MSLLEDVFLEDEAGEAEQLERVIDGDEYENIQNENAIDSGDNSEKEDEAQEDKRKVDPTKPKRVTKNPRFVLNPARLTGPRGIQVIPDHFKDFKFKGKGQEKEDLDMVLKKLEHWAFRLYPKFEFSDCLKKIETLGKKRPVMVYLHKIRTDQFKSEEVIEQKDSSDEEGPSAKPEEDEFDKLLQEQIEMARATPAPPAARPAHSTPMPERSLLMTKGTSSPSISEEQRERMLHNRRLAEERRLAKLKKIEESTREPMEPLVENNTEESNIAAHETTNIVVQPIAKNSNENITFDVNESPDTSDNESDIVAIGQSVVAVVHESGQSKDMDVESNQEKSVNGVDENTNAESNDFVKMIKRMETFSNIEDKRNFKESEGKCTISTIEESRTSDIVDIDTNSSSHKESSYSNMGNSKSITLDNDGNINGNCIDGSVTKSSVNKYNNEKNTVDTEIKETNIDDYKNKDEVSKENVNTEIVTNNCFNDTNVDIVSADKDNIDIISNKVNVETISKDLQNSEKEVFEDIMDIDFDDDF